MRFHAKLMQLANRPSLLPVLLATLVALIGIGVFVRQGGPVADVAAKSLMMLTMLAGGYAVYEMLPSVR